MDGKAWATALFRRSVLKQEKYRQICRVLDDPRGRANLDLGGDNGVLSLLLRGRGGVWSSADLDERTVSSIRRLVTDRVYQAKGSTLPFSDHAFDQVVVIDYLEHVEDDAAAVRELRRVLKPGGTLIVNVPHPRPHSFLTRLRHRIGLTDEWHGHRRAGYSTTQLKWLLAPWFQLESARSYSRSFSEGLDTALNATFELLRRRRGEVAESSKGTVITGDDVHANGKAFRLMSLLYPFMWLVSKLDKALIGQPGYKLVARAKLTIPAQVETPVLLRASDPTRRREPVSAPV